MKTLYISLFIILLMFPVVSLSKEIDISLTGSVGYGHAIWKSGSVSQPGGSLSDSTLIYNPSIQVKHNKWKFQPTLEINYRWGTFNFDTSRAPIQRMSPKAWSVLGGLTKEFNLLSIYTLLGITKYNANPSLTEVHPFLYHGSHITINSTLFSSKVGAYKPFKIGPVKVGPELSLQGWGSKLGFSRCREAKENIIQPNIGLRIQW